jgi:GT2 family glycosyltransferase
LNPNFRYKIAVIIVNYNVEFFLEQCLNSVQKGISGISAEVFVVDNNSIDGSVEMVRNKFPFVKLIANKDNKGFSKANNQAIQLANSEFVLLLNPDTVIEEDTLSKVIDFMDKQPNAGGLGVRMLDGKGKFLPESKRGLPTPSVAFYKIFGLSKIFPKSKKFGQYHLGHLDEFETNEIEILSGAFMLMRAEALEKVGLLDETFFMYGEDIDLSYRILKGGYKNYYFPETRIIHYKGESTKKSSVNYVFVFYKAMVIFAQKHFSNKNARLFSFLINSAIYFRAGLALINRFVKRSILPLLDVSIILTCLYWLTYRWRIENISFPAEILKIALPAYTLVWLISVFFSGGYDRPTKLISFAKGIFWGTLGILVIYALLPKTWQFSRLYIIIGAALVYAYFLLTRFVFHLLIGREFRLNKTKSKNFAIIGSKEEIQRVENILKQTNSQLNNILHVSSNEEKLENSVGTVNQLDQIVHIFEINEIIFCAKDNSAQTIIHWMSVIESDAIDFKIAQPDSLFLIGSNSIETAGDLYVVNINAIAKQDNQRKKRVFDFLFSILFLLLSPLVILLYSNKRKFYKNICQVIIGKKSIVGYALKKDSLHQLPRIRVGILTPMDEISSNDESLIDKLNLIYARDYAVSKDFSILLKSLKNLDR